MKKKGTNKRDRARTKARQWKPSSGRSVFTIRQIQIDKARKKARKEKDDILQR